MTNLLFYSNSAYMLAHLISGKLAPADVPDNQWDELIELALYHNLGGMLLWSLRQVGWARTGEQRWQPLVNVTRLSGRHNLLIERARRQTASAFEQAKIPAIWLKGIGLAHTYYPEPHLRPMSDLDVLVPPNRMTDARNALLLAGFTPAEQDFFELGGFTQQARHHEIFQDRFGKVKLELHFRLLVPSLHYQMEEGDLDWFWLQAEELAPGRPLFQVLKPEANLLHLCAHAVLQNQGKNIDLLHLFDLHLLITSNTLNWEQVFEKAAELRWTYAVEIALGTLPLLFGTKLSDGLLNNLIQYRTPDEPVPAMLDQDRNTPRWDEWRQAFGRMTIFERLRLIWATLFPPAAFFRRQYHLPPGSLLLPYYISHFLNGGKEVERALRKGLYSLKGQIYHDKKTN